MKSLNRKGSQHLACALIERTAMASDSDNQAPSLSLGMSLGELLSELPRGTRIRVLSSRQSSMDLILDGSSDKSPSRLSVSDRFLEPEELVQNGFGELSVSEAAQQLGISRQAVLTAVKRGAIAARRVGGMFLVDARSVQSYRPRGKSGQTRSQP